MNFDRVVKERHSVRLFSGKKPDWREIILAVDAANSVPLAGNIPTLKFILVSDAAKIARISEACQQDFINSVDYLVVACSDEKLLEKAFPDLSEKYARQQAGAAIQNFLLKITDLGLSSCWVGAFADEIIKNALKIPESVVIEAVLPIGYSRSLGKQRRKSSLDSVLFFDEWKNKYMRPLKKVYDRD